MLCHAQVTERKLGDTYHGEVWDGAERGHSLKFSCQKPKSECDRVRMLNVSPWEPQRRQKQETHTRNGRRDRLSNLSPGTNSTAHKRRQQRRDRGTRRATRPGANTRHSGRARASHPSASEGRRCCPWLQHGRTLRTRCHVYPASHRRADAVRCRLYKALRGVRGTDAEAAGSARGGGRDGEGVAWGQCPFYRMKRALGWGLHSGGALNATEPCALEMANAVLCVLCHK